MPLPTDDGVTPLSGITNLLNFRNPVAATVSAVPAAILGSVIPDPQSGVPLAGIGSTLYGVANLLANGAQYIGQNIAPKLNEPAAPINDLPYAPQIEAAGDRARERGLALIPPMAPTNMVERIGLAGVENALAAGPVGAAGLLVGELGGMAAQAGQELDNAQAPSPVPPTPATAPVVAPIASTEPPSIPTTGFGSIIDPKELAAIPSAAAPIAAPTTAPTTAPQLLSDLETQRNLPTGILNGVWGAESSHGTDLAPSAAGASGHFGFMPGTAAEYHVADRNNFTQSATGAANYLADLTQKYGGDTAKALAAYNWGPGKLDHLLSVAGDNWRQGLPNETVGYLAKILPLLGVSNAQAATLPIPTSGFGSVIDPTEITPVVAPTTDTSWTYAQLFGGAATIAALAAGHALATRNRGIIATAADRARYQEQSAPIIQAMDTNRAGVGGTTPTTNLPEVPLPGSAGSMATRLAAKLQDKDAVIHAINDFHAPDDASAQVLRSKVGNYGNEGWQEARIRSVAETGYDPRTQVTMPSFVEHQNRILALNEAQRTLFNDTAHAADELDNRTNMPAALTNDRNGVPVEDKTYVNYSNLTDQQLRDIVTQGRADPAIAAILDERQLINNRLLDQAVNAGLWTKEDAAKLRNQHPNFMSASDIDGKIDSPFRSRSMGNQTGPDTATIPVWERDKQHFEAIQKAIYQNDRTGLILDNVYAAQAADKKLAELFSPSKTTYGQWVSGNEGRAIPYRRDGVLEFHDVNNADLRPMLKAQATQSNALINGAAHVAQFARSGTTQGIAAAFGHVFAIKNLAYTTARALMTRPQGTATGYLDKGLQTLTKGKLGLPGGLDPTAYLGPAIGVAQNAWALGLHSITHLMAKSSVHGGTTYLRSMFGDAAVDAMATRAKLAYANSARGQSLAAGAVHSGGMFAANIPTSDLGALTSRHSVINGMIPELHMANGTMGAANAKFVRLNSLFHDVLSMIADGEHTFYYGLNRDSNVLKEKFGANHKEVLAAYTRNLTGDPTTHGSSQAMRSYNAIAPYPNVAIQDAANFVNAARRSPFTTGLNVGTTLGVPLLASIYTAMQYGPGAVDHMFNQQTADQQAANITLYVRPDLPPENQPSIPIPQTEGMFVPLLRQLLFDVLNLENHGTDPGSKQWVLNGLEDIFHHYITSDTVKATLAGVDRMASVPIPTVMQAALAVANKQMQISPAAMLTGDRPIADQLLRPAGSADPRIPNTNTQSTDKNAFQRVISAVFGIAGSAVNEQYNVTRQRYLATGDVTEAMQAFKQAMVNRLADSLPEARGVLFNKPLQLSTNTPLADHVRVSMDSLRPLLSAVSDARNDGFTRKGGLPLAPTPGATAKLPDDPTMRQAYFVASRLAASIVTNRLGPMQRVEDIRKQLALVPISGRMPDDIRMTSNALNAQLQEALGVVDGRLNDLNDTLSSIIGHRVNINTIDWHKGMEQFAK